MKQQDYDSIMDQIDENPSLGLEYWTYNIMSRKIPIDKERMLESLSYINDRLVAKRKTPFTVNEFKEYLKTNNIQYVS